MSQQTTLPTIDGAIASDTSGGSNKVLDKAVAGKKKALLSDAHAMAATAAGCLEIAFFHPFDTIAKRLMSHEEKVFTSSLSVTMMNVNKTIFKKNVDKPFLTKVAYLYPGSLYAVMYKVLQRVYKFAGQPIVKQAIDNNPVLSEKLIKEKICRGNVRNAKMMTESFAGCLIGIGEVILLPLDRLKVLSQTNQEALRNRGMFQIIRNEGLGKMYAGTVVTMTRNAPGSFCLFGGAAFTKDVIFGLSDYRKATFAQNIAASTVGSCLSISISNPMDVIKTRIQNKEFSQHNKYRGVTIVVDIVKEEGVSAFFKGLTPKIFASAPKLVFAYTMTEYFSKLITKSRKASLKKQ